MKVCTNKGSYSISYIIGFCCWEFSNICMKYFLHSKPFVVIEKLYFQRIVIIYFCYQTTCVVFVFDLLGFVFCELPYAVVNIVIFCELGFYVVGVCRYGNGIRSAKPRDFEAYIFLSLLNLRIH